MTKTNTSNHKNNQEINYPNHFTKQRRNETFGFFKRIHYIDTG